MIASCFLWFFLYSLLGWVYETTLCSISQRKFVNRGFLNGPYCPIYGAGALLVILLFGKMTNPFQLFLCSAVVTCALEYLTSYGMEKLFHANGGIIRRADLIFMVVSAWKARVFLDCCLC